MLELTQLFGGCFHALRALYPGQAPQLHWNGVQQNGDRQTTPVLKEAQLASLLPERGGRGPGGRLRPAPVVAALTLLALAAAT